MEFPLMSPMKVLCAIGAAWLVFLVSCTALEAQGRFQARGSTAAAKMQPHQQGVVEVTFDLLPVSMRFNAPAYPCLVTENGIQYCSGFAETYDPRHDPGAKETSFEPAFDDFNEYSRMWIESQNDARIVVRVRGALVSDEGKRIAHTDIPSGSPYGKGDWVDEWYYIYPDGVHTRHVKIYTGLAPRSLPFGVDREPPRVVHEFMEAMVLGTGGHEPRDDIEDGAVTLIKTVGDHSEDVLPGGKAKTFSFQSYLNDFGEFSSANIMVVNLKSRYKPFTIAMPYGIRTQPYRPAERSGGGLQTWGPGEHKSYTAAIGHMINYQHYRKTATTLEQVYLSGMIDSANPSKELVPLAWSWIAHPKISLEKEHVGYETEYYDPAQKAYVIDWKDGSTELQFDLLADDDYYGVASTIVNPVFVVRDWGEYRVEVEIDEKAIEAGRDFRVGYEATPAGTSLILWLRLESKEPIDITLRKVEK